MSADAISFLYKWQTLLGAALGPFLAILLSALGYWIGSMFLSLKSKKEAVRMTEVSITRTLNDMYFTRKKLEDFVYRVRGLAAEAREIDDDNTYFLSTTNFPAVRDIFFNTDLPNLKFGSPYLHNQLMFADAGIKETNNRPRKASYQGTDILIELDVFGWGVCSTKLTPRSPSRSSGLRGVDILLGIGDG